MNRYHCRVLFNVLVPLLLAMPAASARAQSELAPENAVETVGRLGLHCRIAVLCRSSDDVWETLQQAVANKPADQYLLGIYLITGDKVPRDERAGLHWIGLAAAQGYARAALELNRQRRNGAEIDVDEPRIAAGMRTKADAGDVDARRALSGMYLDGRGVDRDPDEAVRLLRAAADSGAAEAEQDLANLLFRGAPGVAQDRNEALRWMASAGSHGNTGAMRIVSYWLLNSPPGIAAQPGDGYRWLMRAALLDDPDAQQQLSRLFADGMDENGRAAKAAQGEPPPGSAATPQLSVSAVAKLLAMPTITPEMRERLTRMLQPSAPPRTLLAPDPVQADMWFRLAARDPMHDNPQIRAAIEPHMTTAQLDAARRAVANWHPLPLPEVMILDIALPTAEPGQAGK